MTIAILMDIGTMMIHMTHAPLVTFVNWMMAQSHVCQLHECSHNDDSLAELFEQIRVPQYDFCEGTSTGTQ